MSGEIFEANIAHELSHILQLEEKFPLTVRPYEDPWVHRFGSELASLILDQDVIERMKTNSFDSSFFNKQKYMMMKEKAYSENSKSKPENINPKFMLEISLRLAYCCFILSTEKMNFLKGQWGKYSQESVDNASELHNIILKNNYDTPEKALKSMIEVNSYLSTWQYCYINNRLTMEILTKPL